MTNKNIRLAGNTISKNEINLLIQWLKKNEKLTKGKLTINGKISYLNKKMP